MTTESTVSVRQKASTPEPKVTKEDSADPLHTSRMELEDLEMSNSSGKQDNNADPDPTANVLEVATEVEDVGAAKMPDFTSIAMNDDDNKSTKSLAMDSFTTAASTLSLENFCKICHCGSEINMPLIAPCFCAGSLKYVHQDCLQRWIKSSDIKRCELCKYPFSMQSKVKPFCEWERLDMSSLERRKLFCSVSFHIIAITCVIWSLYVLIDRTATEIMTGQLKWPFWTKLVVVAIGFTGGLVFMYIQCKVYVHLCRKWKAYNRIIVVQEVPEGVHKAVSSRKNSTMSEDSKIGPTLVTRATTDSATATSSAPAGGGQARRPSAPALAFSTSTSNSGSDSGGKTNAETQTALRAVSIREVRGASASASASDDLAAVVTVSKILEDMSTRENATIFFTECEDQKTPSMKARMASGRTRSEESSVASFSSSVPAKTSGPEMKESLLICDLPGQSPSSGDDTSMTTVSSPRLDSEADRPAP